MSKQQTAPRIRGTIGWKLVALLGLTAGMVTSASAATLSTFATLQSADGFGVQGELLFDGNGNLFGTTQNGGSSARGSIFRVNVAAKSLTTVATFDGTNGRGPNAGVTADAAGNYYGLTYLGGASDVGAIYKWAPGMASPQAIASFSTVDGRIPYGTVHVDASGNIYGTTSAGGANGRGTVFKVAAGTNTIEVLHHFAVGEARIAQGGLTVGPDGKLYGTSLYGGTNDRGTVFRIDPKTDAFEQILDAGASGLYGIGRDVTFDAAGNYYGVDSYGWGRVFRVDATTGAVSAIASFENREVVGEQPNAGLLIDAAGNLFGTANRGGPNDAGTVFRIDAKTGAMTQLATFTGANGSRPMGGLVADALGNLYGGTLFGPDNSNSIVYRVSGAGFVVPEPTTLAVLAGGAMLLRRRRR